MRVKKSIDDLLAESRQMVRQTRRKVCRRCKETRVLVQSNFCEECYAKVRKEKEERLKNNRIVDSKGYVRVYNEDMKLVLEHRHVMEKHLGRKLTQKEVIVWKDGDRQNNAIDNLMVGFKGGTPLELLECEHCGTKGKFKINED